VEGNDIGVTHHQHVACLFEGLLMTPVVERPEERGLLSRIFDRKRPVPVDTKEMMVRTWRPNEKPLKSVIHLNDHLGIGVDVYTYLPSGFKEDIEHWLARKGASLPVYCYDDWAHLAEDLKFNRDVHTYFTPYEEEAKIIGWHRATVVSPDNTFGF
jgi:hypothetical protein